LNTPITAEEAHPRHAGDALLQPRICIFEHFIHKRVGLDVAVEVIGYKVVVAMVNDRIAKGCEATGIPKFTAFNGVEYFRKIFINLEVAVGVGVAEVFNVLSEVAE